MVNEQISAKEQLENKLFSLVTEGKLPHAMLVTSPEGGGAMTTALKLAQFILCSNKGEKNTPCDDCQACTSVKNLIHPDLFLSFPVYNKDSKRKYTSNDFIIEFRKFITKHPYAPATSWIQSLTSENKQGNISAEECKAISSKLSLKSILGGAKILVIWYAEYLGKEGNRLLKLIEEPPKNTFIILVAEQTNKILGTIQSRTQHFKMPPIASLEIETALKNIGVNQERAQQIAKQSEGNMHKAIQLSQSADTDYFNHIRNWLNALYTSNGVILFNWLKDSNAMGKEELKGFFNYAIHIFEQCIRVQYLPENFWSLTDTETRLVKGILSKKIEAYQLEDVCNSCSKAIYHIERNVYKKVMLNSISFEVQEALLKSK